MLYFDSLTLKSFVEESFDFFKGARIQKIQQPTRRDFIFTIRNNGETKKLYVNITPNLCHVCFMNKENEPKRNLEIPKAPPMFCMLLRKYIESAKISHISQPPYERILEIYIEAFNELSERIHLCLAIELMGKHSNVVLYNTDNNKIIGCAHNVGSEKSRNREMAGNLPYVYPPKQYKRDLLSYNGEVDYGNLSIDFFGFSMPFSQQCEGVPLETLKDFLELKGVSPVISSDYQEYCLFSQLIDGIPQSSTNEMIDNYFTYHQEQEGLKGLKNRLTTLISHRYKKSKTTLDKIEKQLKKEKTADKYRKYGDLIMANLYSLKDYTKSATLLDWETNMEITIDFDETKSVKDNANRYFKLYNKAKKSSEKLLELKAELDMAISYCNQTLYAIENATSFAVLDEIKQELLPSDNVKKAPISIIEEQIIDGFTVYIGKNNKQNDYIISKLAKDNDLWFHSKDCPGSHVLLKITDSQEPSDKTILECAKIAKLNSQGKNSSKIGIIYTKRKYLRKPPAAALGYVTYKNEQEIIID